MIDRITIKNLQAHKKLVIDLDPHVTTIVGPTDRGKSTVLRALRWVTTNRWGGVAWIRDGAKAASTTLTVNGREIHRHHGKSSNTYALDDQKYKAFGKDVPPEISTLLNLSDINFQQQHDAPFWFCETAGEVSRQLNQIVNLNIIDSTLANLDKVTRGAKAHIQVLTQQLEDAKTERSSLTWVKKADKTLTEVENADEVWKTASEVHESLTQLTENIAKHTYITEQGREATTAAEQTLVIGEEWKSARGSVSNLKRLVEDIRELKPLVEQVIPNLEPLFVLKASVFETEERSKEMKDAIVAVRKARKRVQSVNREFHATQKEFKEILGEVCPLCERKL